MQQVIIVGTELDVFTCNNYYKRIHRAFARARVRTLSHAISDFQRSKMWKCS